MTTTTIAVSLDSVLRKVRAWTRKRRVSFQPFFADFDRLHCGRVSAAQFSRVLHQHNLQLSPEETAVLVHAFSTIVPADATAANAAALQANPEVAYADFLTALEVAPSRIAANHRCLQFGTSSTDDAMTLFERKHRDGHDGDFYMAQQREAHPSSNIAGKAGSTNGEAQWTCSARGGAGTRASIVNTSHANTTRNAGLVTDVVANPSLTADELIRIFRQQCALYRLRYEDALTDFDKMKTGTVTAAQFESALGRMPLVHFALRSENVETLVRTYAGGYAGSLESCFVDYRSFLRDIHPSQAAQRTADGRAIPVNFFSTAHAANTYIETPEEAEKAAALLATLRSNIRSNRISLSPILRDFDRVRKGIYEHRTCTNTRFARALATQKILLQPEQLQLLIRKYTVPNPDGSPSREVNYYLFVQDVDETQVGKDQTRTGAADGKSLEGCVATPAAAAVPATTTVTASTKESAIQKVAHQTLQRRLNVGAFFIDADPRRSGIVTKERLGTAFGQAGLTLSAGELSALQTAFASPRVRGGVDTQQLLDHVRAAMTAQQKAAAAGTAADNTLQGSYASADTVATGVNRTMQASPQVQRLLHRLRHSVKVHNTLLTPFFADFDRHHRGAITRTQFAQACTRHRLPLSAEDLELLTLAYQVAHDDAADVRYLAFIRDVGCGEEEAVSTSVYSANNRLLHSYSRTRSAKGATMSLATSSNGGAVAAGTVSGMVTEADVDAVLTDICLFLQERRPRVSEFFPDGDELRHQHVTPTRFRHCLSMLGLTFMTEKVLQILEHAFASAKAPGDIDYPAFVYTLRAMLADGVGLAAVTQRRLGTGCSSFLSSHHREVPPYAASITTDSAARAFATSTLQKVQHTLKARRTATITAFREYDRARKGYISDGQFFACLKAFGVVVSPDEATALLQLYGVGNGQVHYLPFAMEVDDATLISVS